MVLGEKMLKGVRRLGGKGEPDKLKPSENNQSALSLPKLMTVNEQKAICQHIHGWPLPSTWPATHRLRQRDEQQRCKHSLVRSHGWEPRMFLEEPKRENLDSQRVAAQKRAFPLCSSLFLFSASLRLNCTLPRVDTGAHALTSSVT